jgi:putative DNA primase/helicase
LYRLVRKPLASVSISSAALYRVIEKYRPTLLVDEADTFLQNNDELRGVINGGHTKTQAFVLRANREDGEIEQLSIWAPKAIALIGKLHPTLHDRSLVIKMVRRTRGESIAPLRDTPQEDFDKVRSQIVR